MKNLKTIAYVHPADELPLAGLVMHQPLPNRTLDQIDPFLLLHHHGTHQLPPHNPGLPFAPHPHRGFETVTFIFKGNVVHKDSRGHESQIDAGGVQWMTAGMGIVHSENINQTLRETGGELELIQLWVNLPSHLKMTQPHYKGLQKSDIPALSLSDNLVKIYAVSGQWEQTLAPVQSLTDVQLAWAEMEAGGRWDFSVGENRNLLFYVLDGKLLVNGTSVGSRTLVEFGAGHTDVEVEAQTQARILVGHAEPYGEKVVAQGPFVMNSTTEILEAMRDYRMGKMGMLFE